MLHLGAKVLDDDIGGGRQAHERGMAIFALEVQHYAALVAMQVLLVRPATRPDEPAIPSRGLDLDDVRTPIGEQPHRGGSRAGMGKVENRIPAQG